MNNQPLWLTKIFLHHWHRFRHHLIEVQDSLYLAGHNGSGKSSVLDAIQLVLVADMTMVRFNRLGNDKSIRDLDSYVRGKLGEDHYLRPAATTGMVALEFSTPNGNKVLTAGVCLEAAPNKLTDRLHFILPEALDPDLLVPDGKTALTRRELKAALKKRPRAKQYEGDIDGYQNDLLNDLGNLNRKQFYELFLRALHFRPENNISRFVEQWVLDEDPVRTDNLLAVRQRLAELEADAHGVRTRLEKLAQLIHQQDNHQRLTQRVAEWELVVAGLKHAQAEQELTDERLRYQRNQQALTALQQHIHEDETIRKNVQERLNELNAQLRSDSTRQEADRLDKHLRALVEQIRSVQQRRNHLHTNLHRLTEALRPLAQSQFFGPAEKPAVQNWLTTLAAFAPTAPPPPALAAAHSDLLATLKAASDRLADARADLRSKMGALTQQKSTIEDEIRQLEGKTRRQPQREVEQLRQRLASVTGQKVKQLWEVVDIPDQHQPWQEAVEAMLGPRRFNFVVPPQHFAAATRELRAARREDRIEAIGLIDLEKANREARPAQAGSLAEFVSTQYKPIRAYLDHVLGDIVACANDADLRQHRRAITADLMLYTEWVQRTVRQPELYIGQHAVARRLDTLRRELADLEQRLADITAQQHNLDTAAQRLRVRDDLLKLSDRLTAPLDESDLQAEHRATQEQRQALDLSGLAALEAQVAELKSHLNTVEERLNKQRREQGQREQELTTRAATIQSRERTLTDRQHDLTATQARLPDAWPQAEKLLAERCQAADLTAEVTKAEQSHKGFETQRHKANQEFYRLAVQYNLDHAFNGNPTAPDTPDYKQEHQRLEATDLPAYLEKIEAAKREAELELREHVLHSLRDKVQKARHKLREMNTTLQGLDFRGEKYRFDYTVNPTHKEAHDLLMQAGNLGDQPLHESVFYQQHSAAFERFYQTITYQPTGPADPRAHDHEALLDYRRYLTYDIHITHPDGREERLSKTLQQRSGGETQTPFYFIIAASFHQRYHVGEITGRPTLRLVAFDEAFSKMDQAYIEATLELFARFKLQIITATPLERCEYIAPHVRTTLVLTGVSNGVDILRLDDYRNTHVPLLSPAETPA